MSVAIRTITRLVDADDVNVTVGAGVDEYALTWDNDTARFVLRAVATGGLLATGATTGATVQAQAFTVGVSLADTTTATTGVVFKGANRFIHNFHHPTGGGAVPSGRNTFIGIDAGNLTTGATATSTAHSSDNTSVGHQSLKSVTIGMRSTAVGSTALQAMTSGDGNAAFGYAALFSLITGNYNMAVGPWALYNTTGSNNVAIGVSAMENNTTGSNNVVIGGAAGMKHADGTTNLTDPENSVYIGASVRGFDNTDSNSIVIGYSAIGKGANTTVIGSVSTTATTIYGAGEFPLVSAATNAVTNVLTLGHDTSGTATNGFGAGQLFALESSTTAAQNAARIRALWNDATHATRKADLVLTAYDAGGEREGLRIRGDGSAPAIGFLGATPALRVAHVADPAGGGTVDAEARSAINSILATLETFGFHATS